MINAYNRLTIDLSSLKSEKTEISLENASIEEKLGGVGRGVNLIKYHLLQHPHLENAFALENIISFDLGFLTGSSVMTARRVFATSLSPLKTSKAGTNGVYYSAASGDFGPFMKSAGIDSLVITGMAESPSYLVISEDGIEYESAKNLAGKTTKNKIRALSELYSDSTFAVIGPAGENGVRFANIAISTSDDIKNKSGHMRFLGRGGFGAVLGSKNLLAIVVRRGREKNKLDFKTINHEIKTSPKSVKYTEKGTFFANIEALPALGLGLRNNFTNSNIPPYQAEVKQLYREEVLKSGLAVRSKGCLGCPIQCWKEVSEGNEILGKIDYEPGVLLGPNIGIYDMKKIMRLITIGDELGMDTISLGGVISYAMETANRFGDFEFASVLAEEIVYDSHYLGQGVMRAGRDKHPAAMHVKGIELPGYLGNANPAYAFAIAGPHMSMDTYNRAWFPGATNSLDEWVKNCTRGSNIILYDMVGLCKFAKPSLTAIADLYRQVYGPIVDEELFKAARRVYLIARQIDEDLGFTAEDEILPLRCHEDFGGKISHFNTLEFFQEIKKGVYAEMKKE